MNTQRFIIETLWSGGTSIITEYLMGGKWICVHSEPFSYGRDESVFGEPAEIYSEGCRVRKIYYPEERENSGIWYKNNKVKTKPSLPKFTNIETDEPRFEPVYENLAEAHFYIVELGEIIEVPELMEFLNRIEDDMMFFNFNWNPEENNPIPLKTILNIMHKNLDVEILFHDKEGKVIYKVKLSDFRFLKIYGLRTYDWTDSGLKEIQIEYSFGEEEIIV